MAESMFDKVEVRRAIINRLFERAILDVDEGDGGAIDPWAVWRNFIGDLQAMGVELDLRALDELSESNRAFLEGLAGG